jgi:2,3-dihydroxybenzoate decarboxylase
MVASAAGRLAGFATLPTADPASAADELRRATGELGLKGALINGPVMGRFLDHEDFDPILKAAAELRVPLYLHPDEPMAAVREAYLEPYATTHPMFRQAAWGFTIETGTHAIRLVLSNAFERHPDLQIILGHLGETIPFLLVRIDEALSRNTPMKNFAEVFRAHFHVTTSGFFSDAALACTIAELGADRVMFSIDTPFASAEAAVQWMDGLPQDEETLRNIAYGNAARLLGLDIEGLP